MSPKNNRIGLSIFEDRINLVEIIKEDQDYCVKNVDEEFFEEIISEKTKEAKYIHILQNAFNEILLRKSLTSQLLSVGLSPSNFKIFQIPTDKNLTKNDLKEYIKWEITKLFPTFGEDYFTFQKR
jgi:Tfp pilus assembly PilM family ATPase